MLAAGRCWRACTAGGGGSITGRGLVASPSTKAPGRSSRGGIAGFKGRWAEMFSPCRVAVSHALRRRGDVEFRLTCCLSDCLAGGSEQDAQNQRDEGVPCHGQKPAHKALHRRWQHRCQPNSRRRHAFPACVD